MKIVQINTVVTGCTGRIACSIKEILEQNGHECVIAYGRGKNSSSGMYRIGNDLEVNVHGALTRVFDTAGLHSKHATREFIKWLKSYKPDVVHLHNLHGYYINYEILFSYLRESNIKVFWTLHDCWPYTGHCPYYTYVRCEKWISGCHDCQQKLHHPTSYVVDRSKKNYTDKKNAFCGLNNLTIITPSYWLMNEVNKSFLKDYNVEHIPNGINLRNFHTTNKAFRKDNNLERKVVIVGVANLWAATKGMDWFIKLDELLPKDQYQIVLVGLSEKQMDMLPGTIRGIEHTENIEQLVDIYSSADIFINPTSEDNFPTTNIEALACGTPVITFDVGGSAEAIDASCGLIIDKDINDLVNACKMLGMKDRDVENKCIKRSKMFDENKCFRRYMELYEQV